MKDTALCFIFAVDQKQNINPKSALEKKLNL
jgi:hypothetical protein